jgi:hypothetical protein
MTGDQSRELKVGNRVCWNADKKDQGTITETNWAGVTIKWDNRSEQAILHNDMAQAGLRAKVVPRHAMQKSRPSKPIRHF